MLQTGTPRSKPCMKEFFIDLSSIEAILPAKERSADRFVQVDTILFIVFNKRSGFSLYCRLSGKRGVRSAECGVWKTQSVENAECRKCGV